MQNRQHRPHFGRAPHVKCTYLPTEILCEIFAFASSFSLADDPKLWFTPVVMSRVDSRWRNIMLDLPDLWTRVRVTGYNPAVVRSVFARSKELPLDIFLDYQSEIPPQAHLRLWGILICVFSEMRRCRSLTITTFSTNFQLIRNAFGPVCIAPLLESLKLTCTDGNSGKPSFFPVINYNIDKLATVYVEGVVLMNTLSTGVKEMELRNTVGPWGWPTSGGSLYSTFHSLALQRLTLDDVPVPQSTTFETPSLTELVCRGTSSETIFNSDFNPVAPASIEISRVESQTWTELVSQLSRHWQLQRFGSVRHLTFSNIPTSVMRRNSLDVRFFNAFAGLTHCSFVNASPKVLFDVLRENPTVWAEVSFDVDGTKVSHPAIATDT